MTWHPDIPEEYRNQIVTGDARKLAERIPDESVDLIFTDPVYDRIDDYRWLAETSARVMKPDRAALIFYGIGFMPLTIDALINGGLTYRWQGIWYISNGMKRADMGYCNYSPFLWMEKGRSKVVNPVGDIAMVAIPDPGNARKHQKHQWEKQPAMITRYVKGFTDANTVVFDPFTGSATVPAVCKMLGRNYIAFEIEPDVAEDARERVLNTQPPLFVLEPEQMELELSGGSDDETSA